MTPSKFQIIPAIDLLDGKVVRLFRGKYDQSTVYGHDPAERLRAFIEAGAHLIHIVDLNAARTGDRSINVTAVASIVAAARGKASLELGGGIRDMTAVKQYMDIGIHRCIIGTAAVTDPEFVSGAVAAYGAERIIVGVDALDGRVKVDGWEKDSGITTKELIGRLSSAGVKEIIFTEISRDGALTGPAVDALFQVLSETKMNVIASGGVSELADIETLAMLAKDEPHLVGVIVGKALYEGKVDLAEAVTRLKTA